MHKVNLPKIVTFRIRLPQLFIVAKLAIYLNRLEFKMNKISF